jgi:zinc/manganese transport system substrate-binding protein
VPRTVAALTALAAIVASAALSACSAGGSRAAAVSPGDPARCPGPVVDVAVSVGQWGDLVRQLGGACATVTTIVSSAAIDPHDFEPGTSALAAISDADVVVVNGAGYDHWAADAVATLDPAPVVVSAAEVAGVPASGANPHLWYSPAVVHEVSTAVGRALARLATPRAADYLAQRSAAWTAALKPYDDAVRTLSGRTAGHSFAATEPVFDLMAQAIGLSDATPEGYRRAASNDSEPSPGDLAAFEAALAGGRVDVLIYNTQTSGTVPSQLRAAAKRGRVPVVEVSESPPDAKGSFVAWQLAQLTELSNALGATS